MAVTHRSYFAFGKQKSPVCCLCRCIFVISLLPQEVAGAAQQREAAARPGRQQIMVAAQQEERRRRRR